MYTTSKILRPSSSWRDWVNDCVLDDRGSPVCHACSGASMGLARGCASAAGAFQVSSYGGGGGSDTSDGRGGTCGGSGEEGVPLKSVCHAMTSQSSYAGREKGVDFTGDSSKRKGSPGPALS